MIKKMNGRLAGVIMSLKALKGAKNFQSHHISSKVKSIVRKHFSLSSNIIIK